MKENVNEKVKRLIEESLDPFFQQHMFVRKGTDYSKAIDRCRQHIFFRFDIKQVTTGHCYYFANLEFPEIERLFNLGEVDAEAVNTIGKQMGYLDGNRFERIELSKKTDVKQLGRVLIDHVQRYALVFVDRYSSLTAVQEALEGGELFNLDIRDAQMKLAVIYHLKGQNDKALELLDRKIEEQEGRPQQIRFIRLRDYLSNQ